MMLMTAIFVSCKKNEPKSEPLSYDPAIDGVIVRSPVMIAPATVDYLKRNKDATDPTDLIVDLAPVEAPAATPESEAGEMGDMGMDGMGNPMGDPMGGSEDPNDF